MAPAPWIYINDAATDSRITQELIKLIPNTSLIPLRRSLDLNGPQFRDALSKAKRTVVVLRDTRSDDENDAKKDAICILKASAMKFGTNFVSVNVVYDPMQILKLSRMDSPHHLNVDNVVGTGQRVYDWLFEALTIRETLHLISEADMRDIDTMLFPEYEYCSIDESRSRPKDAKIQFVALILTKPQVTEGNKLVWSVADKTGTANFYFQHRGEYSQYTWDWVMSLKPGDRKALPRMPMVQIKEKRTVRVIKAPFRVVGTVISTAGLALHQVGKGVSKVGKAVKMGSSSEWVLEADVDTNGKKIDWTKETRHDTKINRKEVEKPKTTANEKNEKIWDDAASDASTEAEPEVFDEKAKEFL